MNEAREIRDLTNWLRLLRGGGVWWIDIERRVSKGRLYAERGLDVHGPGQGKVLDLD